MNEVTTEPEVTPEEEPVVPPETTTEPEEDDEKVKLTELANNQKVRAEKAEAELNKLKAAKPVLSDKPEISSTDSIFLSAAIAKGTVHEDDVERVQKYARLEGITIKEALKNDELKAILEVRNEHRKSAEVANVAPSRRGPARITDEVLIERAAKGDLPESEEDIARLMQAKAKQG